jgi:hypothetical protein
VKNGRLLDIDGIGIKKQRFVTVSLERTRRTTCKSLTEKKIVDVVG